MSACPITCNMRVVQRTHSRALRMTLTACALAICLGYNDVVSHVLHVAHAAVHLDREFRRPVRSGIDVEGL